MLAMGQSALGEAMHKIAFHVDQNDLAVMNLALNNVANVRKYYQAKGETVQIEVITYGPGLNMLVDETSPVKDRIAAMSLEDLSLQFSACGNTHAAMSKKAGHDMQLIAEAQGAFGRGSPDGTARAGLQLRQAVSLQRF
ncbi:MAG: hypothetical protein R3D29_03675 [Nitratireductor sp.]